MNERVEERLKAFATRLLERRGALVDWPDPWTQGVAVLPGELMRLLNCPESIQLSLKPEDGGFCVNLSGDFLDRCQGLVALEPRETALRAPDLYLKKAGMEEPVARAFSWLNARVRVVSALPASIQYHTWIFSAVILSDDRWEDLLALTLNAETMAEVAKPDPLEEGEGWPGAYLAPGPDTWPQARRKALGLLEGRAEGFVQRMEGRFERDRKRLRSYYMALLKEPLRPGRSGSGDEERKAARTRAVEVELRRKLAELDERYALRLSLAALARIRVELPVLAVVCEVTRKRARADRILYWNPLSSELEPLCCSRCGANIFAAGFSDETVQPLCEKCL